MSRSRRFSDDEAYKIFLDELASQMPNAVNNSGVRRALGIRSSLYDRAPAFVRKMVADAQRMMTPAAVMVDASTEVAAPNENLAPEPAADPAAEVDPLAVVVVVPEVEVEAPVAMVVGAAAAVAMAVAIPVAVGPAPAEVVDAAEAAIGPADMAEVVVEAPVEQMDVDAELDEAEELDVEAELDVAEVVGEAPVEQMDAEEEVAAPMEQMDVEAELDEAEELDEEEAEAAELVAEVAAPAEGMAVANRRAAFFARTVALGAKAAYILYIFAVCLITILFLIHTTYVSATHESGGRHAVLCVVALVSAYLPQFPIFGLNGFIAENCFKYVIPLIIFCVLFYWNNPVEYSCIALGLVFEAVKYAIVGNRQLARQ